MSFASCLVERSVRCLSQLAPRFTCEIDPSQHVAIDLILVNIYTFRQFPGHNLIKPVANA